MLLGIWDNNDSVLTITRPDGRQFRVQNVAITAGLHRVFGVETVGREVHVLTGPRALQKPNRRVRFSDSGAYKGSTSF